MKSLDEQIEYMRKEVLWHRGQEPIKKDTKDTMWKVQMETCQAILDTLLQLKGKSNVS